MIGITLRLLSLVVPVSFLAAAQDWTRHNYPWAVVLLLVWLVGVVIGPAFARPILDMARDLVEKATQRRISSFERRYREYLTTRLRKLETEGPVTVGSAPLDLEDVFIDVSLIPTPLNQISTAALSLQHSRQRRQNLHDFLWQKKPARLAVIGGPGSGKTTLLKHTAYVLATQGRRERRRRPIAVLLQLRELRQIFEQETMPSLAQVIEAHLRDRVSAEPSGDWWEVRLRSGRCTVLLDGLDEIALGQDRHEVSGWINQQIARYGKNDFVVTSRPGGYSRAKVSETQTLAVQPFTPDQAKLFVRKWHRAVAKEEPGLRVEGIEEPDQVADELLGRVVASTNLLVFTENPLLLTMLLDVHWHHRRLPDSKTDLYTQICQVLLDRRQTEKRLPVLLSGEQKMSVLSELAFEMMKAGTRVLEDARVVSLVTTALGAARMTVSADAFLDDVSSNGLVQEHERGTQSFAHLSFQEYLAARHLHEHRLDGMVGDVLDSPWWWETIEFFAGLSGPDGVVTACLDRATPETIALAQRCAVLEELSPELQGRLNAVTAQDEAASSGQITRAAQGALRQYAYHANAIDDRSSVCHELLSWNLFRLFLRSKGRSETHVHFRIDPSTGALLGLWRRDVSEVMDWINSVYAAADGDTFRLPSAGDLLTTAGQWALLRHRSQIESASATGVFSVWTTSGSLPQPMELWPASSSALTLRRKAYARALAQDRGLMRAAIYEVIALLLERITALASIPYGTKERDQRLAAELHQLAFSVESIGHADLGSSVSASLSACAAQIRSALSLLTESNERTEEFERLTAKMDSDRTAMQRAYARVGAAEQKMGTLARGASYAVTKAARLELDRAKSAVRAIERQYKDRQQQRDDLTEERTAAHLEARDAARHAESLLKQMQAHVWKRIPADLKILFAMPDGAGPSSQPGLLKSVARAVIEDQAGGRPASESPSLVASRLLDVLETPAEVRVDLAAVTSRCADGLDVSQVAAVRDDFGLRISAILRRQAVLRADDVSLLRGETLVLAFEAQLAQRSGQAETYRQLAAALTLLDARAQDPRQISEAVILVVDRDPVTDD